MRVETGTGESRSQSHERGIASSPLDGWLKGDLRGKKREARPSRCVHWREFPVWQVDSGCKCGGGGVVGSVQMEGICWGEGQC